MAIENKILGAPATVEINGRTLLMNGVKFQPSGSPREKVNGGRKVAGFKRGEPEPATLTGTPVMDGRWTLAQLLALEGATIRVQLGNGDVHVISNACCATVPNHDSMEGTTDELTFLGTESEPV